MTTSTTWEYHLVNTGSMDEQDLNELGAEGWALVAAPTTVDWVFKRPGPDLRTRVTLDQRNRVSGGSTGPTEGPRE